jgi:hypothetical protein
VDERNAAQAVQLIRALRNQLHKMTRQLAWLERIDVTGTTSRPLAIRCEAAALRLDISEAQFLIDRLQRRYLDGDQRTQQHPDGRQRRAMLDPQAK